MTPRKPADIDARAAALLEWMGAQPWASCLVLGRALALKHYVNIRPTHDCDAWWTPAATAGDKAQVLSAVESFLARQAPAARIVRQRWGDVDSVKVSEEDRVVFSFQIADRSVPLEPDQPSGWGGVAIESFTDKIASKMCALVERGAPRDFIDIYHVAQATDRTAAELWQLWQRKTLIAPSPTPSVWFDSTSKAWKGAGRWNRSRTPTSASTPARCAIGSGTPC